MKIKPIIQKALRNPSFCLLAIVFTLFMLLRFYDIPERVIFAWDQERDANQIYELVTNANPTLIGPRVVGPQGFFLAPWYTYLLAPFYVITGLHPWGSIIFLAAYNICFFFVSHLILKQLFQSEDLSIFFLFFWSLTFTLVNYDTIPWNPLLIPLGIILILHMLAKLYKIAKKGNLYVFGLLGFTIGLFTNFHFQFVFMGVFVCAFFIAARGNMSLDMKKVGAAFAGFVIPFLPLLLFDLRHDFLNSKLLFGFFLGEDSSTGKELFSWLPVWTNVIQPFTYGKSDVISFLLFAGLIVVAFILARRKDEFFKPFYYATGILLVFVAIFFALYGTRPSEYYFLFVYPFVFLILIDAVLTFSRKEVLYAVLGIFILINLPFLAREMQSNPVSLAFKDQTVRYIKGEIATGKGPYNITFSVEPGGDTGFRYLIRHYGIPTSDAPDAPHVEVQIPPQEGSYEVNQRIGVKKNF